MMLESIALLIVVGNLLIMAVNYFTRKSERILFACAIVNIAVCIIMIVV